VQQPGNKYSIRRAAEQRMFPTIIISRINVGLNYYIH
jgi:hypothetical protein